MQTHYLKTWPRFYAEVKSNEKTFEVRKNDRNFQVGDLLILQSWDPASGQYVNPSEAEAREIGYLLELDAWGAPGVVVMSLKPLTASR